MSGTEATRLIKRVATPTAVLALTTSEDEKGFFEMLPAGASGYIPKRAAPDDLVPAIRVVAQGGVWLYPSLAQMPVRDFLGKARRGATPPGEALTTREHVLLALIAKGRISREIACIQSIHISAVNRHRETIMRKLSLRDRADLVKYAIGKGPISVHTGKPQPWSPQCPIGSR